MRYFEKTGKRRWLPAAAFLLTALLLCVVFACFGLFPFGEKTLAWGDMKQQVIPLMLEFKDILRGDAGFFLNMQNAGGMSFLGVFFFFLSSPFTFLIIFFEKTDIYSLINILVLLKLAFSAGTAACFFRREFPRLSDGFQIFLSISYALCGYGMLYYQNIVWLDILYLFPVLMLGFSRLIREGRSALFCFSLCLALVINYYLSFMIFLATIILSAVFTAFCVPAEERGDRAGKIGLSALISLSATAVIWLPSLLQCLDSARTSGGIIESIIEDGLWTELTTVLPVILCTASVLCMPLFFLIFPFTAKRKAIAISWLLTVIPLFFEPINKLWHTGSYQAFPARYGYIPLFLSLWYVGDILNSSEMEDPDFGLPKRQLSRAAFFVIVATALLGSWMLVFHFPDITTYCSTLWVNGESFFYLLGFSSAAALSVFICIYLTKSGRLRRKTLSVALVILSLLQGGFYSAVFIGSAANIPVTEIAVLETEDSISDDGLFRVKLPEKFCDVNLVGATGFATLNHYTSLTDERYLYVMKKLGYSAYWMEVSGCCGTKLSDILLSNKYTLDLSKGLTDTGAGNIGYILPTGVLPKKLERGNRFELQNELYSALTGDDEAFIKYAPKRVENLRISEENGCTNLSVHKENAAIEYDIMVGAKETLYFDAFNDISTNLREKINDHFRITVNGERVASSYPTQRCNGILELGIFSHEKVKIKVEVAEDAEMCSFGVYGLPESKVKTLATAFENTSLSYESSEIFGTAEAKAGESLFISVPYYEGMKIFVDGAEITPIIVLDCFVEIPLNEGISEFKLTYIPKGFISGAALSALSLLFLFLCTFFRNTETMFKWNKAWCRFARIALNIVFALVFLAVYLAPMAVLFAGRK